MYFTIFSTALLLKFLVFLNGAHYLREYYDYFLNFFFFENVDL